jgi:hypothetical protein
MLNVPRGILEAIELKSDVRRPIQEQRSEVEKEQNFFDLIFVIPVIQILQIGELRLNYIITNGGEIVIDCHCHIEYSRFYLCSERLLSLSDRYPVKLIKVHPGPD